MIVKFRYSAQLDAFDLPTVSSVCVNESSILLFAKSRCKMDASRCLAL